VEKENYLLELCRYVVLNPVRAGMVQKPNEWKWSSYEATAGVKTVPFYDCRLDSEAVQQQQKRGT
jgi:hypothetical protein